MTQTDDATGVNTVQCSTCGADIHSQAEICPECGTRQRSPPKESGDDTSLLSAAASIPVPGLGQMINRQFRRGLAFMTAFFGGYYLFNALFGGALNFLLFGVWGYAIYDAYRKPSRTSSSPPKWTDWVYTIYDASLTGGQRDDYEDGAAAGVTDNTGRNQATSESRATTTVSSGTANTNPDVSSRERGSPSTKPNTANVVSDRTPTSDSATADSGANAASEGTAESTAPDDSVDEIKDGDSPDGYEKSGDDNSEDNGSKWSRDDSDRSWSRN
ncbi:zinc ribbon domain-containing protein [Salinibaculum salinum]|uniref:zinc ribbon domain-containing protein n=1 Tax=Salinibaculum salinum TaxID=3131996 RepID=UPI0030EB3E0D